MDILLYELIAVALLLFLWLTCAFEAFDGLSGGRIRKIEAKDEKLARQLESWMERDDSFRAAVKLLLFVLAAAIGALSFMAIYDTAPGALTRKWAWVVVLGAVALASFLCELVARFILFRLDIFILRVTIPALSVLCNTIFLPLTYLMNKVSKATDDWHKKDDEDEKVSVEDEILSYVESYDDAGNDLEEGEKQMIRGILDLGDKSVHEIMTPRVDLVALPATADVEVAKKTFTDSGHSRIPIYGRSVDEIKGILFAKDFIEESRLAGKTLTELSHKPIFVPETKEVTELLEEIKRSRNHFAVIIDEYGGTSGIITFEDIIEEIVGEVHDEYDTEDDFKRKPQLMPDGSIVLDARTPVSAVNDIADTDIPDDDDEADTIGGYICSELGRIPETGETYTLPHQFKATILEADKRKIQRLKLEIQEDGEGNDDE